jgi:hypothetical protein
MAAFFLVLAVIVGVVIGDAVVANTSAASIQLFDRAITSFTQGQLLVIAAGAGFVFASLLFLAWGSSKNRRLRRKERREVRRGMEGRIGELEKENASLRDEVDRDRRTSRLGEMVDGESTGETTQASRRVFSRRAPDRRDDQPAPTTADSTTRRDVLDKTDREHANNR